MDDTTIRSSQLREQLKAANARIVELERRVGLHAVVGGMPNPGPFTTATSDTAKAWLDRSIAVGTYEGVVLIADRLASGLLALDVELRYVKARLEQQERAVEYLSRSSMEAPR